MSIWDDDETSLFRRAPAVPWFSGNGDSGSRRLEQAIQDWRSEPCPFTLREHARVVTGEEEQTCHLCKQPIPPGEVHNIVRVIYRDGRPLRTLRVHLGGKCEAHAQEQAPDLRLPPPPSEEWGDTPPTVPPMPPVALIGVVTLAASAALLVVIGALAVHAWRVWHP